MGRRSVGDPHLGAVQDPAILRLLGDRDHARRIRAVVRLRETEAADDLAARHLREPFLALFFFRVWIGQETAAGAVDQGLQRLITARFFDRRWQEVVDDRQYLSQREWMVVLFRLRFEFTAESGEAGGAEVLCGLENLR